MRRYELRRGSFEFRFPYAPEIVDAFRALTDKWYVPESHAWYVAPVPASAAGALQIVEKYGFRGSDQATSELERIGNLFRKIGLDARLASVQRYLYRAPDFGTLIWLAKHASVSAEVESQLGAEWDRSIGAYRVDGTARNADQLLTLAGEYDFYIEPAEYERLVSEGNLLFDEDEPTYFPLKAPDRLLYRMLVRLSKPRLDNLVDAVRNYRLG